MVEHESHIVDYYDKPIPSNSSPLENLVQFLTELFASHSLNVTYVAEIARNLKLPSSHVKGDPFHSCHRFELRVTHGATAAFSRAYYDALFRVCNKSLEEIKAVYRAQGESEDVIDRRYLYDFRNSFLRRGLERTSGIPGTNVRLDQILRIVLVVALYANLENASDQVVLFNKPDHWTTLYTILIEVSLGHYEDPVHICMYVRLNLTKDGFWEKLVPYLCYYKPKSCLLFHFCCIF
jgi:hypothetical protein